MKERAIKLAAAISMTAFVVTAGLAHATEGMFQHAYGLRHKALAGAGAASAEDATAISLNPAGLVDVGDQFNMGLSLFMPFRQYTGTGTTVIDTGTHKSTGNFWPAPTLAYARQIDSQSAFAFSIFGNGGMNTTYKAFTRANPCPAVPSSTNTGPFCSGKAGVDLMQMFVSAAYARRFGEHFSIGIAPIFAIQRFKAYGLQPFADFGMSAYPTRFSNNGYNWSVGGGARIGVTFKPTERLSFGASYQTRIWMTNLKKYRGLFAEKGNLDIPANLQVGIAYKVSDDLKLMLDYRHIFNSDVKAIGGTSVYDGVHKFGTDAGPGFGWRDTNSVKLGVEYSLNDDLILRAGYAYVWPVPMRTTDTAINIISPGVIRHEFTGGGTWRWNANNDIDFAFMIAPTGKQSGAVPPVYGGGVSTLKMYQFEVSLGWTYTFGTGSARAR